MSVGARPVGRAPPAQNVCPIGTASMAPVMSHLNVIVNFHTKVKKTVKNGSVGSFRQITVFYGFLVFFTVRYGL